MATAPRRTLKRKSYKSRQYKKSITSPKFVKSVQRVINRNLETKQAFLGYAPTSFNASINNIGDCLKIMPNIGNGNTAQTRIGDTIRAQSLNIKGWVNLAFSSANYTSRVACRMMVIQPKNYGDFETITNNLANWMPSLLQQGSTTKGFTGDPNDLYTPINKQQFHVYYNKVFKLTAPVILSNTNVAYDGWNSTKFFNISLKTKNKKLEYDSAIASALQPIAFSPVLVMGFVCLDGSTPSSFDTILKFCYNTTLNYKDA